MADSTEKAPEKKKRRLRTAPTLREQAEKNSNKTTKRAHVRPFFGKVFGSRVFSPFRAIGRFIKKLWLSGPLRPVRFIARLLGKILLPVYFRNSWKELRLVVWPNNRTTWRLTGAVLLFAIVFGLMIAGLDYVMEKGFREVLLG
jgi:preprotein translocase SecE subunit